MQERVEGSGVQVRPIEGTQSELSHSGQFVVLNQVLKTTPIPGNGNVKRRI